MGKALTDKNKAQGLFNFNGRTYVMRNEDGNATVVEATASLAEVQ